MTHQTSLSDFFTQRQPQSNPTNHMSPRMNNPELPTTASLPIATMPLPLPPALNKVINDMSTKYAAIFCNSINIQERINALQRHKEEGTIPQQMQFKFKKLFNNDNETNLRSTVITISIDNELSELQSKLMELRSKFDIRFQDLENTITSPLTQCEITISTDEIITLFNTTLQNRKLEFILKQNKDKQKKLAKQERFQARQESENDIATLTNRQVSKLQKEINDLKSNLKKVKITSSKLKPKTKTTESSNHRSKNVVGRQARSNGKKKRKNGKKQNTSKSN